MTPEEENVIFFAKQAREIYPHNEDEYGSKARKNRVALYASVDRLLESEKPKTCAPPEKHKDKMWHVLIYHDPIGNSSDYILVYYNRDISTYEDAKYLGRPSANGWNYSCEHWYVSGGWRYHKPIDLE